MKSIEVKNLQKQYKNTHAVKGSNFTIHKGEIVALLGQNGAGKSTTIKMLCGLLKPTSGSLTIEGYAYDKNAQQIKQHLGYMPEESATYTDVSVKEYLLFFGRLYGNTDKKTMEIAKLFFKQLDLHAENKQLGELSKGMRRKVLLIRSLLNDPTVLIYDEPASGLDPQTAHVILDFLKTLKAEGKTILFSSHNLEHVRQIADRIIIMKNGDIIADTDVSAFQTEQTQEFIVQIDGKEKKLSLEELKTLMHTHPQRIQHLRSESKSFEELYLRFIESQQ